MQQTIHGERLINSADFPDGIWGPDTPAPQFEDVEWQEPVPADHWLAHNYYGPTLALQHFADRAGDFIVVGCGSCGAMVGVGSEREFITAEQVGDRGTLHTVLPTSIHCHECNCKVAWDAKLYRKMTRPQGRRRRF